MRRSYFSVPACEEAMMWTSQGFDTGMSLRRRILLRLHLRICAGCQNFHKQIDWLHSAIHALFNHGYDVPENPQLRLSSERKAEIQRQILLHM